MAIRLPLVVVGGQMQQLAAGDTVDDPSIGSYAPGSLSVAAGQYAQSTKRLTLTGSQRATLAGDSCLRIN